MDRIWKKYIVSGVNRSIENIKNKFTTMTSNTKKEAAFICKDRRITGGGNSSERFLNVEFITRWKMN